jgi:isopentenyl diphosphate isomerase/L-lactate dehydrogenase-like FMN-dependent dehydrogenase
VNTGTASVWNALNMAAIGDKATVLFDSGVRTGADVFKALALGAHAVCVGRLYSVYPAHLVSTSSPTMSWSI